MNAKAFLGAALVLMSAAHAAIADEYQYILTPGYDPAAASVADSRSMLSGGELLETGTFSCDSTRLSLEARFRTWLESLGIRINSRKMLGTFLLVR